MPKFEDLYNENGDIVGRRSHTLDDEDDGSFFGNLMVAEDFCPECGFEGAMKLTAQGWKCPKCRTLIVPIE